MLLKGTLVLLTTGRTVAEEISIFKFNSHNLINNKEFHKATMVTSDTLCRI